MINRGQCHCELRWGLAGLAWPRGGAKGPQLQETRKRKSIIHTEKFHVGMQCM